MAVTCDKYELPLIVEDTALELAKKLGLKRGTVYSNLSKNFNGKINGYKLVRIKI